MDGVHARWFVILLLTVSTGVPFLSGCNRDQGNPELYLKYCAACHGPEGEGLRALYPPLQGSPYFSRNLDQLACLIAGGIKEPPSSTGGPTRMRMPAFPQLDGEEMGDLIVYLHHSWGSGGTTVSRQDVETWLRDCH